MDGVLERLVKLEHTVYYKYAEDTLKLLNNNTNRLLSLYGVTEEKILFEGRANKLRGYFAKTGETAAVTAATKGANIWVRIAIGSAYFFKDIGDEIGSVKLSTTTFKENALIYVAAVEEARKGLAEKTYHGELASLRPFYSNYSQGKLPTQKELNEYNKTKNTNYSMYQIKTRLWKLFKYEESKGNPDYYVKPRRVELLPQMNRLWKDEKTNERIR
jgi:hypothetical protein